MNGNTYDVVIIGGGVIGSSIARALSKYECRTVLLEKEEDVCSGTSKANSAKDRFFKSKAQCKRQRHDGRFIQRTRF